MTVRLAACSCGQLVAEVRGAPLRVSLCHCLACQRRTGSVFGVQARFPAGAVTITGDHREYVRVGDAGGTSRQAFCPVCGATVWYRTDDAPDVIAIPVGAFASPTFPMPEVSVYEARRHAWVALPGTMRRLD